VPAGVKKQIDNVRRCPKNQPQYGQKGQKIGFEGAKKDGGGQGTSRKASTHAVVTKENGEVKSAGWRIYKEEGTIRPLTKDDRTKPTRGKDLRLRETGGGTARSPGTAVRPRENGGTGRKYCSTNSGTRKKK